MSSGKLHVVPTPVGNLEDITVRAVRLLKEITVIACEDTRVTGQLLKHFDIKGKELVSLHAHNEKKRADTLVQRAMTGEDIVLVSDAGTPGFSDPGAILIGRMIEAGVRVEVLPGPTAAIPALIGSGLPVRPAHFEGFLPHKKGRQTRLRELSLLTATIILYESPHRLLKLLGEVCEYFGPERQGAVAREISKMYEEYTRGSIHELLENFEGRASIKGEIVVVIAGKQE